MAVTALLCWSLGSELLFDPWQPHAMVLPFLCLLMLVWSLTCGDLAVLPWTLFVASLVLQSHLSYALLVPVLVAWGGVGLVIALRTRRAREPELWPQLRRRVLRVASVSVVVLAACWYAPIVEQATSDGPGNMTLLERTLRESDGAVAGFGFATRALASVLALPPWFLRPSVNETFFRPLGWRAPSIGAAVGAGALVVALVAASTWLARKRRDRVALAALATAVVALVIGFITLARAPVTIFGPLTPHTARWLWSLAAFVLFALGGVALREWQRHGARDARIVASLAVTTAAIAGFAVPTANTVNGPNSQRWAMAPARDLTRQLGSLDPHQSLFVDDLFARPFDPYGAAVVAELRRRQIPFVAKSSALVRQFGPRRQYDGNNADAELLLRVGDEAAGEIPGARRVALHQGLSRNEQRERARLAAAISDYLTRAGSLRLTSRGRQAMDAGELPTLQRQLDGPSFDAAPLIASGELVNLVDDRGIEAGAAWMYRFERYAALETRWNEQTVAVFERPLERGQLQASVRN
jgi:hypothetical protein